MMWMGLIRSAGARRPSMRRAKMVKIMPVDVVGTVPPLELYFPPPYWTLVRFGR